MTADEIRKALDLLPFEGFARKQLATPPKFDGQVIFGPGKSGKTTRMICSMLAACSIGRTVSVYAKPQAMEAIIKDRAKELAEKCGVSPKLIVGSLAPADLEFFDHSYYEGL